MADGSHFLNRGLGCLSRWHRLLPCVNTAQIDPAAAKIVRGSNPPSPFPSYSGEFGVSEGKEKRLSLRDITVSVQEEWRVGGGWPPSAPSLITPFFCHRLYEILKDFCLEPQQWSSIQNVYKVHSRCMKTFFFFLVRFLSSFHVRLCTELVDTRICVHFWWKKDFQANLRKIFFDQFY